MSVPTYFIWIVVAYLALGSVAKVVLIGEPRKPITKGEAAASVFLNCAFIVALVLWVTG